MYSRRKGSKVKANNYLDPESKRPQLKYRSYLRQKAEKAPKIGKILPWRENQEDNSPLPRPRQTYTQIKGQDLHPFNPNS